MKPRLDRVRDLAKSHGVDAMIALSPENFAYVSGAYVLTVESVRPRQAFAVVTKERDAFCLYCSIERATMEDESWIEDQVVYTEFADIPIVKLAEELQMRGLASSRLGIDLDYLPQSSFEQLTEALPQASFVNTTEAVAAERAAKDPDEIEKLEAAARGTHAAVLDAFAMSQLGDSERTIANRISEGMLRRGADTILFMCFGSGLRSIFAHGTPTDRVPQEAEIIRFDTGGRYRSYLSDFARTFSSGSPTTEQREYYRKLVEVHRATIGAVQPGMPAEDVYFFCRDAFAERGLPFHMPHIGHSFGIELHENPMLRPGDKTKLRAGMVLNIEPAVLDPQRNMYHVEDLFVVTDDGHRLLTLGFPQSELPILGQRVES